MTQPVLSRFAALAQGAIMVTLAPQLAHDARINLTPLLAGITKKNFKAKLPGLKADLVRATRGQLAKSGSLRQMNLALDSLEDADVTEGVDERAAKILELLKGKIDDQLLHELTGLLLEGNRDAAMDEPPDFPGKPVTGGAKVAQDAAADADFAKRYPSLARVARDRFPAPAESVKTYDHGSVATANFAKRFPGAAKIRQAL